jgi:hypothetical protein
MSSPKDRLQEAAHRLAGAAEKLEEVICPIDRDSNGRGFEVAPNTHIPSDSLPQAIAEGIKEVRQYADEIEGIVR